MVKGFNVEGRTSNVQRPTPNVQLQSEYGGFTLDVERWKLSVDVLYFIKHSAARLMHHTVYPIPPRLAFSLASWAWVMSSASAWVAPRAWR